jgi:hypothetical protein
MQAIDRFRRRGPLAATLVALACLVQGAPAAAGSPHPPGWDQHKHHHGQHHRHYRYAPPPRYVVVDRLPYGGRHVVYRGAPYYYHGGYWYRPQGAMYAMIAPPAGLVIDSRGVLLTAQVPLLRW